MRFVVCCVLFMFLFFRVLYVCVLTCCARRVVVFCMFTRSGMMVYTGICVWHFWYVSMCVWFGMSDQTLCVRVLFGICCWQLLSVCVYIIIGMCREEGRAAVQNIVLRLSLSVVFCFSCLVSRAFLWQAVGFVPFFCWCHPLVFVFVLLCWSDDDDDDDCYRTPVGFL